MTRTIAALLIWMFMASGAAADHLYFVYLARTDPAKATDYQRFLDKVSPIWQRHNMKVVMRAKVIEKLGDQAIMDADEIGVLVAESRKNFNAYIADPDYQSIKSLRHGAMQRFTVLEGKSLGNEAQEFLTRTPLVAASFSDDVNVPADANLTLAITLAASVKGEVEETVEGIKLIQFHALSYDDNPYVHLPENRPRTLLVIAENLFM